MAPKSTINNKRHVAHLEQVRRQSALIRYLAIGIIALVVILVGYGILSGTVLMQFRSVASVNNETISVNDFQLRGQLTRSQLINQYGQYAQFAQFFGSDPASSAQINQMLSSLASQLDVSNKELLGEQVLDTMIDELLIVQESKKMGITVSDEELEARMQENFGYFPNGTPTAAPIATEYIEPTLSPAQLAIVTITPTASPEPTSTPDPSATPTQAPTQEPTAASGPTATAEPTATPLTLEGYQTQVADMLKNYNEGGVKLDETAYRNLVRVQLYREKLLEKVVADAGTKAEEEQIWVRHILVTTPEEAVAIKAKIEAGQDFGELAKEFSQDTGSAPLGGDLGWQPTTASFVPEFLSAMNSLQPGQISEPVQTQYGYHIIQVISREMRPVDSSRFDELKQSVFDAWLANIRAQATIEKYDVWKEVIPTTPALQ